MNDEPASKPIGERIAVLETKVCLEIKRLSERLDLQFAHAEQALVQQFTTAQRELAKQDTEYARRLKELNGKAEQDEKDRENALLQIKELDTKFVSRLHFEDKDKAECARLDRLERETLSLSDHKALLLRVSDLEHHRDIATGRNSRSVTISIAALIISLFVLFVAAYAAFGK
jgi:hypothetical protein